MPRKPKKSKVTQPVPTESEVVTWKNTFNANDRTLEDISNVAKRAQDCGYRYFAYIGSLWRVLEGRWKNLGVGTEHLDAGVTVGWNPDIQDVKCEVVPQKRWILVRRDFQYDDEYYHARDGGHPVASYTSHTAAQQALCKADIDEAIECESNLWEFIDGYGEEGYEGLISMPWEVWRDWLMEHGCPHDDLPSKTLEAPTSEDLQNWWEENEWVALNARVVLEHFRLPFYDIEEVLEVDL